MRLIQFQTWSEGNETESVWINPDDVSSVSEYSDRKAYGGYQECSRIDMRNGKSFKVHGHVSNKIREVFES